MALNTQHFERCIVTLESSLSLLRAAEADSIAYEVYRNAVVKGFELSLEAAGKLLSRALKAYIASPRQVDSLTYKDLLRHAGKHGILTVEAVARWLRYRDNRNSTAHDYGVGFAEETLTLLPSFVADAHALQITLQERLSDAEP